MYVAPVLTGVAVEPEAVKGAPVEFAAADRTGVVLTIFSAVDSLAIIALGASAAADLGVRVSCRRWVRRRN